MKTGKTPLYAGILLVIVQVLLVLIAALGKGSMMTWAQENFLQTILFCLPAIIGISLISSGLRRRREIERMMRDPHQIDPWNR